MGVNLSPLFFSNSLDRISEIQYNIGTNKAYQTVYTYEYNRSGQLHSVTDHINGEVTVYEYDAAGRLRGSVVFDESSRTNLYSSSMIYNDKSQLEYLFNHFDYAVGSSTANERLYYVYTYTADGNIDKAVLSDSKNLSITFDSTYDNFGRVTTKTTTANINSVSKFYNSQSYSYVANQSLTSPLVSQMVSTVKKSTSGTTLSTTTYKYTYDKNGNITEIKNASNVIQNKYYYDDLGQLIREDNRAGNYTCLIKYDDAGNILGKSYIDFTTSSTSQTPTTTYTYGNSQWGDLLTKINGDTITYDAIGNPTAIGYNTTLTWQGRQLMSVTNSYIDMVDVYTETTSYTYNADGIRTSKNVNGVVHEYILDGALIVAEKWSDKLIVYLYDENNSPIGLKYRANSYAEGVYDYYFFEKNIQGDVVAVYNSNGTKIGTYVYDAWGQIISTNVASGTTSIEQLVITTYNPFRYRGYYYDVDTGWYYLQSRYYNPEWGRFINADACLYNNMLGYNLFTYCYNNPISYIDPYGENGVGVLGAWASSAWWLTLLDGPLPVGDIIFVGGCAVLAGYAFDKSISAVGEIVDIVSDADNSDSDVPDSLPQIPAPEDVDIDIDHIMKYHHPDGGKGPQKDKFEKWMTQQTIKKMIEEAYEDAYKNFPQSKNKGPQYDNKNVKIRYRLRGKTSNNSSIELWIDIVNRLIDTAYPK